jgi:hypothetical protein
MNTKIQSLTEHFSNGLALEDFLPIKQKIARLENEKPGAIEKITWVVDGQIYSARAGNLDEEDIPYFKRSTPIKRTFVDRLLRRPLRPISKRYVSFHLLPDNNGFLRFESGWDRTDNCLLLDAYGKERMRLTVPWQLTAANYPASNAPPTSFWGISEPDINPADGKKGEFGVKAWVELAGEYYFELDWRTGQFLWGKEIRF